jgi:phosphate transport system permease protein
VLNSRQVHKQAKSDVAFRWLTAGCAGLIIVIIGGILALLVINSRLSIDRFGLGFFSSREWNPVTQLFGAASSIYGTLVSTALAMILATPVALVVALFLVELAGPKVAAVVGTSIELLAAIPSIIYGMWGLFVFAPLMANHVQPTLTNYLGWIPLFSGEPMGVGMLTAGIILAIMILPFICAVARDVFLMVPPVVKEAAHGMGSTTWEVTHKVTVRYCIHGIIGALFLGLGRAIGETMAVTFVIGNNHNIDLSLFSAGNSIASSLANEFAEADGPVYLSSLFYLGLVLFLMTFLFQIAAYYWLKSLRKSIGGRA